MRQVSSVAAIAAQIAVFATCVSARADVYTGHSSSTGFNLPGVSTPSGYDEVRAADGTTCRSALGNRGAYVDVGGVATERDGSFGNGAVYGRVIVPLGQKPDRIDCGSLYQLEIERLRAEVAMMRASQEAQPGDVMAGSFTDGAGDPFEDGPGGGGFEDEAPAVTKAGDAARLDEPVNRTPAGFDKGRPTPPVDLPPVDARPVDRNDADPWRDETAASATTPDGSFQWDAATPLPFAGPIPTTRPVMVASGGEARLYTNATDAVRELDRSPSRAPLYATAYADVNNGYGAGIDPVSTGSIPRGFERASVAPERQHVAGDIVANWAASRPGASGRHALAVLERVYGPSLAVPYDDFDALIMTEMGATIPAAVPFDATSAWLDGAFAD